VGRGGGGATGPGPGNPPGGDRGTAEAAVVLLRGLGAGAHRLGCPTVCLLLFGPPYDELASEARGRGWIVQQLPGRHLHQLVDADGVARSLLAIADQMGITKS
jgi:hypothetical protein